MLQEFSWRKTSASRRLTVALLIAIAAASLMQAQQGPVPGRNVNMVSGDKWPDGDPYLQRQNEPSMAASTRNPLHLLAGSNDYRTVDLPIPVGEVEAGDKVETGDAWLGLYKSMDGGQRWKSTLLPGYPQDTSTVGQATPMYGYQAAADPVVRPGAAGMFYYAGLVFDRNGNAQGHKKSRIFVSRFIDNNNKEAGDPIQFLGATAVASDSGADGAFLDKPWMAVDIPRPGAKTCTILSPDGTPQQSIKAGAVYVTYTVIRGDGANVTGTVMFSRSVDCGQTWSTPIALSRPNEPVNQGTTIGIDPVTGIVYVAWRQFATSVTGTDSIVVVKSAGAGGFEKPKTLRQFYAKRELGELLKFMLGKRKGVKATEPAPIPGQPVQSFDQATVADAFRTNTYPTMAVDGTGRVYVAWSERGYRTGNAQEFDASIILATSRNGTTWTTPKAVEPHANPGHQIMPSLAFGGGKLMLVYYDLREDISQVWSDYIRESQVALKRHTIDLRAAQAVPADDPQFGTSVRVSEYVFGSRPNSTVIEQLQFNPPNLPLFQLGKVPFMGDYVDVAPAPAMVQDAKGAWKFNTADTTAPVFHTAWTDNRDVRPPTNGDWTNYTPPQGTQINSVFDPSQQVAPCSPGSAGMRNQNVYTSRITAGLLAGSPGNSKPLDQNLPRAFVVFAQNTTTTAKTFRMTITSQPVGGRASFAPLITAPLVTVVDLAAPARSTVSRTVIATSSDPDAKIPVDITEINVPTGQVALNTVVTLNPDITNPEISNPEISNPEISNPEISNAEVYNPEISNPEISNPEISNPEISNPEISNPEISNIVIVNPEISNTGIANPDIANPEISNPEISNPEISNPEISNGSVTDVTWTVTNTGNTTANYTLDVLGNVPVPEGIKVQIIVYKTYKTPVSDGCTLKYTTHTVLVSNIVDPTEIPSLFLEPGGEGKVTVRIVDPDPTDDVVLNPIDPTTPITPTVEATAVNTEDLNTTNPTAPEATPPSSPTTSLALGTLAIPDVGVSETLPALAVQAVQTLNGNTTPLAGATIVAAIVVNPGGGTLAGTTVALTDANGFALFSNLSIDRPGTGYQLSFTASVAGVLPITSPPFNVTLPDVDPLQNLFLVTNTADSGIGSLRQAMINAGLTPNGTAGPDVITFAIRGGTPPYKIALQSPLPALNESVVIDGTTQAGYDPNVGPLVEVSGATIPSIMTTSVFAFSFGPSTPGSAIRGLSITGFGAASGINASAPIRSFSPSISITGNWLGIAPDRTVVGNQTGIIILAGTANIGGTGGAVSRNVIGGSRTGMLFQGGSNHQVKGNYIGVGPDGFSPAGNTVHGISMFGHIPGSVIGGLKSPSGYFAADSPANVIARNGLAGIILQELVVAGALQAPTNTQILGNVIGLDVNGDDAGNGDACVNVRSSPGTIIGAPNAGNVLSGSPFGIRVQANTSIPLVSPMPQIQANYIGLDPAGLVARPNSSAGIALVAPAVIGGNAFAGEGNFISGNGDPSFSTFPLQLPTGTGISTNVGADNTIIQGNRIGLNVNGAAVPNGFAGISVNGTHTVTIGGAAVGAGNVISGNAYRGIQVGNGGAPGGGIQAAQNVLIKGNRIGTDAAGNLTGLGNGGTGVAVVAGTGTVVGGTEPGAGNFIAGNGVNFGGVNGNGVTVFSTGTQASVLSNSIHSNSGLGIDIGTVGITANDPGDTDTGANDFQNFPTLTAEASGGGGFIDVTLDSRPGTYRVEIFLNASCDGTHGEGATFLMETPMIVGASPATSRIFPPALSGGQVLTATATNLATGETSEFSPCATVVDNAPEFVGPVGGGGGAAFSMSCPSGSVMTAMRGRAGDDIDRTELWCMPKTNLNTTPTFAGAVGGFGGVDYGTALTCPAGYAVTGLHGRAGTVLWGGFVVDTIGVICTNPATLAAFTSVTRGNPAPSATNFTLNCSVGKQAVGLFGGQGGLLDRIGLICQ